MKPAFALLAAFTAFLGFRVFELEAAVQQVQTNAAIAVLSAESANDKIGAFAPYFTEDREKFAKAWIDSTNMPLAVFPDHVLGPLKRELEAQRSSKESQQLKALMFKGR